MLESYLSHTKYGYDFVIALSEASIDAGIKEYLYHLEQPYLIIIRLKGKVNTTLEKFMELTGGINPLLIENKTNFNDPRVQKCYKAGFVTAYKMKIGFPEQLDLKKTSLISLGDNTLIYKVYFSEFKMIKLKTIHYFEREDYEWIEWNQSMRLPNKKAISNYPYVKIRFNLRQDAINYKKTEINAISGIFSLQQMLHNINYTFNVVSIFGGGLFDKKVRTIGGNPENFNEFKRSIESLCSLQGPGRGTFLSTLEHFRKIFGVHNIKIPEYEVKSSIPITNLEHGVSGYKVEKGEPVNRERPRVGTFNYLCASNQKALENIVPFDFNWIRPEEIHKKSGVLAINRNIIVNQLQSFVKQNLKSLCFKPSIKVSLTSGGSFNITSNIKPNTEAFDIQLHPTGEKVLSFNYKKSDSSTKTKPSEERCDMEFSTVYSGHVLFKNNRVIFARNIDVSLYINKRTTIHSTTVEKGMFSDKEYHTVSTEEQSVFENIYSKSYSDSYYLSVRNNGELQFILDQTTKENNSKKLIFSGYQNIIDSITNKVVRCDFDRLAQMPSSISPAFILPGTGEFVHRNVQFSNHQDLLADLTFMTPC